MESPAPAALGSAYLATKEPPMDASILVVDDDPALRDVITDFLTEEGYEVATASDGESALSLIADEPPDLVISDVMMPRRDGLAVLLTLRRAGVLIPVLLMSAAPLPPSVSAAPFVPKPFELDTLLAQVQRLLANARHSQLTGVS
jgi:two-component system response regulator MprA